MKCKLLYIFITQMILKISSNKSTCLKFYQHACQDWASENVKPKHEPIWNHFTASTRLINENVIKLLNNGTVNLINQAPKVFFRACLNNENGKKNLKQLRLLVAKLEIDKVTRSNLIDKLIEIKRVLNINPILKFDIDVDFNDKGKYALYINPGDFIYPEHYLSESKYLNVYENLISNTLRFVFKKTVSTKYVHEVINFEKTLLNLTDASEKRIKINSLEISVIKEFYKINSIVVQLKYLQRLTDFLSQTSEHVLQNYLTWAIVKDLSREISSEMRLINFQADQSISNLKHDIPRELECAQITLKYFESNILKDYLNVYFEHEKLHAVEMMSEKMRKEFLILIEKSNWLTDKSKIVILEKISSIKILIGFKRNFINQVVNVFINNNHFNNILKLRSNEFEEHFKLLHGSNNKVIDVKWPSSQFDSNAYYSVIENAIVLPLGILTDFFFDLKRSASFNYGSLGSLIGHEFSHSLDKISLKLMQTESILNLYENKLACFVEKYNNLGAEGKQTLGENVADNVGLKISYEAAKQIVGFNEQTFFLTYAQLWCETTEIEVIDEHAPVGIRVLGVLNNLPEFITAFNCINEQFCVLW